MQQLPPVIYFTHDSVCMSMLLSNFPASFPRCVYKPCILGAAIQTCVPRSPDPMHPLGSFLSQAGMLAACGWRSLPDLSHPWSHTQLPWVALLPPPLTLPRSVSSLASLSIFKLFQSKLGQSVLRHLNPRFPGTSVTFL